MYTKVLLRKPDFCILFLQFLCVCCIFVYIFCVISKECLCVHSFFDFFAFLICLPLHNECNGENSLMYAMYVNAGYVHRLA
jgi:hypothetical protein